MNAYQKITIEKAMESYKFGYAVVCDGDRKAFKYETKCNVCGKLFQSNKITYYCDECIEILK